MKIVVLDGYTLNPGDLSWDELGSLGELEVYDRTPEADLLDRIGDAEIIFTNKTVITRETLEKTKIKWIGVLATGYNVVDVEAAKEMRIPVCNVPTYGNLAVAQFTIGLLLELCHHIGDHDKLVKEGEWQRRNEFCFWNHPLVELKDKTMGIIGFGRNGQKVGDIARALEMNVIVYDKFVNNEMVAKGYKYVELDELFKNSDVISLHCPLTEENSEIIRKDNINKMKEGVIILNTARGGLVDEKDLAEALDSGYVGGAGLDVVSSEPIKANNPLLQAKNCIITPHIAWAPLESRNRLLGIAVNNLREYLKGNPVNVVNK